MADKDINPFADPGEINPFGDPSVTTVTSNTAKGLEDYNPFAEQSATVNAPPPMKSETVVPIPQPYSQPATLEPVRTEPAPPAYTSYALQQEQDALKRKQEELDRKANEIAKKEQELNTLQQKHRENNFPPFPKRCCVGPCFYHDISIDIPIESQKTCRMMFYLWQLYSFVLMYNVICSLALLCVDSGGATTFAISILYVVVCIPCSFGLWYWPVYKALRSDSSFNYMLFFFVFFFQIIFTILYSLGIIGTCGWINASSTLTKNKAVAVMMYIAAILFSLQAVFQVFLLKRIHNFYRTSGASLEKAQGEFARGVMTNKHVQGAATEGVKAGVASAATTY